MVVERKVIINKDQLIELLSGAGDRTISLAAGGGNWSAKEKQTQSDALYGVINKCFEVSTIPDPARNQWVTRFENILMQSSTEQALYDFKVGLHALSESGDKLDKETFSKIIKTLTSMANTFPNSVGYCLLGVADNKPTADRHKEIYGEDYISYSSFYITGIGPEAHKFHGSIDKYFTKIVQLIKNEPITDRDKDNISRNITTVKYFDKDIIIMKIESDSKPSVYNSKYFVRHGSNIEEILPQNFGDLFARFKP